MASITACLNKIKSAIYGKEVRGAIYDSIYAINAQVESTVQAETGRTDAEKKRQAAEDERIRAEEVRTVAENVRKESESVRSDAETGRHARMQEMEQSLRGYLEDADRKVQSMETAFHAALAEVPDSGLMLDPTLSQSGYAADAKSVGDAIAAAAKTRTREQLKILKSEFTQIENSFMETDGSAAFITYSLRTDDLSAVADEGMISLFETSARPVGSVLGLALVNAAQDARLMPCILMEDGTCVLPAGLSLQGGSSELPTGTVTVSGTLTYLVKGNTQQP